MGNRLRLSITSLLLISSFIFTSIKLKAQPLPNSIYKTDETAEDLIDYALAGNWDKINIEINRINSWYNSYRAEVISNKLSPQLLDFYEYYVEDLKKEFDVKNAYKIAFAANQLTGIGVDFESHYNHKIPIEVSRLDYLGRELLLEAKINDIKAINRRLNDIDRIWAIIKPVINSKHGIKQGKEFEKIVSEIKSLKSNLKSAKYNHMVNQYSDQIDKLENLF